MEAAESGSAGIPTAEWSNGLSPTYLRRWVYRDETAMHPIHYLPGAETTDATLCNMWQETGKGRRLSPVQENVAAVSPALLHMQRIKKLQGSILQVMNEDPLLCSQLDLIYRSSAKTIKENCLHWWHSTNDLVRSSPTNYLISCLSIEQSLQDENTSREVGQDMETTSKKGGRCQSDVLFG
jgi:hypothetical protein